MTHQADRVLNSKCPWKIIHKNAPSLAMLCGSVGDRQAATGPSNCKGHFLPDTLCLFFMKAKVQN